MGTGRSTRWWWLAVLLGAAPSGCIGGQSGTETPDDAPIGMAGPAPKCPCGAGSRAAVRATVTSQDDCGLEAVVTQVLRPAPGGGVLAGDRIAGLPEACSPQTAAGDDVLILYTPSFPEPRVLFVAPFATPIHIEGTPDDAMVDSSSEVLGRLLDAETCLGWLYPDLLPSGEEVAEPGPPGELVPGIGVDAASPSSAEPIIPEPAPGLPDDDEEQAEPPSDGSDCTFPQASPPPVEEVTTQP